MDKTKFTINPHLDSEGFVMYGPPHYLGELTDNQREDIAVENALRLRGFGAVIDAMNGAVTLHAGEYTVIENPPGWREVDGVTLPPITWAERV